jgi:hypothetical protein
MAQLIHQHASQGNQVLVFTRHRHVADLFCGTAAKLFSLEPAGDASAALPDGPSRPTTARADLGKASTRSGPQGNRRYRAGDDHQALEIRRRRWTAEEFPGELTDQVRVIHRPRPTEPAADDRCRPSRRVAPAAKGQGEGESARVPADQVQPSGSKPDQPKRAAPTYSLSLFDPVELAPSVERRAAKKLRRLGIKTVADWLRLDPEAAAAHLDDQGVQPATIAQWQAQANLMCRVPQLRAVDARALVAAKVTTAEKLAGAAPRELWKRIGRTIRSAAEDNAEAPSRATVTAWVRWAKGLASRRAA